MHAESQPGIQETFLEGMLIPVSTEGKATFSHILIWKLSQRENTSPNTQKHDFLPQPGDALLDKIITGDHGKEAHAEQVWYLGRFSTIQRLFSALILECFQRRVTSIIYTLQRTAWIWRDKKKKKNLNLMNSLKGFDYIPMGNEKKKKQE